MKRSGLLLCTFGLNRVLQFLVLTSVCWTYQDSRVEATTCDCAADCVSYCTAGRALAKYYGITGPRYEGDGGSGKPSRGVYCVSNCHKATSCSEVKSVNPAADDGEYTLHPFSADNDVSLRVYCHDMTSGNPKEFLTLPAGPEENYSIVSPDQLVYRSQCSGTLQRDQYVSRAGTTKFRKLRIKFENSSVEVIRDDYTFASTCGPNEISYAHAGDCYSGVQGCAKGTFKVNLIGTELKLAPGVHWALQEWYPASLTINDMFISTDRKVASARCGGACGHCWPVGNKLNLLYSPDTKNIADRETRWWERGVKEAIYERMYNPTRNREGGLRVDLSGTWFGTPSPENRQHLSSCVNLALGKPTAQSSTEHGGVPQRAVDGNTNGDFHGRGSCTHTNNQGRPWWHVDLGRSQAIGSVVVFNRQDCCPERLNNFRVYVGDSPTVTSNPQCGGNHAVTSGQQNITVDCGGRSGRYVGISLPTYEYLTLCEVLVYGGGWLARKSSWVSAGTPHVSNGVTHDAAKVLDGDSATYWNPRGMGRNYNNWYIILDLTASHTLTRIALNNFGDTTHDIAAFSLQKSVSASPYTWEDVKPVDNVRGGTSDRQVFGGFQGTARYWRFVVTQTHSGWQPWLRELNLFGTSVTANPNSSCPVAVGNPSPAALIAVSVVAGVAIVLAVAHTKQARAEKDPGCSATAWSRRELQEHPRQQYETIPDTVAGPLPIPAARVPPVVRHTDVELQARASGTDIGRQGEGEGGRKRRHQMAKGSRGGHGIPTPEVLPTAVLLAGCTIHLGQGGPGSLPDLHGPLSLTTTRLAATCSRMTVRAKRMWSSYQARHPGPCVVCPKPCLSQTVPVPNRACPKPCLFQTVPVPTLACPKPCLSQTVPVPKPCLFQTVPVPNRACPKPCLSQTVPVPTRALSQTVPVPNRACSKPCLFQTVPVPNRACPKPCLSQPLPVPNRACSKPCLSQTVPVPNRAWPKPCLAQTVPVPNRACPKPCLSQTVPERAQNGTQPICPEPCPDVLSVIVIVGTRHGLGQGHRVSQNVDLPQARLGHAPSVPNHAWARFGQGTARDTTSWHSVHSKDQDHFKTSSPVPLSCVLCIFESISSISLCSFMCLPKYTYRGDQHLSGDEPMIEQLRNTMTS
ncbi:hypothetical protein Bbelb_203580 [Branchiostoma belcheri]|nr:hypothetical protein Bbelb_203580 [Branchiostoma belcheri]